MLYIDPNHPQLSLPTPPLKTTPNTFQEDLSLWQSMMSLKPSPRNEIPLFYADVSSVVS